MTVTPQELALQVEHAARSLKRAIRNYRKVCTSTQDFYKYIPEIYCDHKIVNAKSAAFEGTRVFGDRIELLKYLSKYDPKACIEIGTSTGAYAKHMLAELPLKTLDLVDIDCSKLPDTIRDDERVRIHEMTSSKFLRDKRSFLKNKYDYVYIDADHSYQAVKEEIALVYPFVRKGGLMVFNDYTRWSVSEAETYGVISAVNELINRAPVAVVGLALRGSGHADIALEKQEN